MLFDLKELYASLRQERFFSEAGDVLFLFKLAGYDDEFRQGIDIMAAKNPKAFNSWFDGKNRLYFDFKAKTDELPKLEIDPEVEATLNKEGYQITDYLGGYCSKGNRVFKIGKILEKLKNEAVDREVNSEYCKQYPDEIPELKQATIDNWKYLINRFINDAGRKNHQVSDNLMIVISQDPHDIAQMSYGRQWDSCMNISTGVHKNDAYCEVKSGGLIAYLISKNDKEIKRPLARVLIRRFSNISGISIAKVENNTYGLDHPGFFEFVNNWVQEKNKENISNSKILSSPVYNLEGSTQSDSFGDFEIETPKDIADKIKMFYEADSSTSDGRKIKDWLISELIDLIGIDDYKIASDLLNHCIEYGLDSYTTMILEKFPKLLTQDNFDKLSFYEKNIIVSGKHYNNSQVNSLLKNYLINFLNKEPIEKLIDQNNFIEDKNTAIKEGLISFIGLFKDLNTANLTDGNQIAKKIIDIIKEVKLQTNLPETSPLNIRNKKRDDNIHSNLNINRKILDPSFLLKMPDKTHFNFFMESISDYLKEGMHKILSSREVHKKSFIYFWLEHFPKQFSVARSFILTDEETKQAIEIISEINKIAKNIVNEFNEHEKIYNNDFSTVEAIMIQSDDILKIFKDDFNSVYY